MDREKGTVGLMKRWSIAKAWGERRRLQRPSPVLLLFLLMAFAAFALGGCGSRSDSKASAGQNASSSADMAADVVQSSNSHKAESSDSAAAADSGLAVADQYGSASSAVDAKAAESASAPSSGTDIGSDLNTDIYATDAYSRKVVYQANVTMEVKDYAQAQTKIRNMVKLAGGYILQFADRNTENERGGNFTLKIPADGFYGFIDQLKSLDPKLQQSLQGKDVTEEYVDLSSRLKAKQVQEDRLLSFMEKATKADDLVQFSNQLSQVQEQVEQIKGRMRYINQNVAYSTVDLRVYQLVAAGVNPTDRQTLSFPDQVNKALGTSSHGVVAFLQGLVIFLCYALPIAFFLVLFTSPIWYVLIKRWRSGKKQPPTPSEGA